MIKIIKDGAKTFKATCPNCGCEFTYENEDINISVVICPCCNNPIYHKQKQQFPNVDNYVLLKKLSDGAEIRQRIFSPDENPCDSCPNNPKYLKTPYIGDSPCQWCQKNPNKVTCTSNASKGEIK
jgi:hypothetical protein|nr:MAG TPA: DNA-directed RNA polymerase [Caudoviricetes sp.]